MMINNLKKVDKELIEVVFEATKDKRFTKGMLNTLNSDKEKEELIGYIKNNPGISINDINYKAALILIQH